MQGNFKYHNPTKLYFGEQSLNYLKDELKNFLSRQVVKTLAVFSFILTYGLPLGDYTEVDGHIFRN